MSTAPWITGGADSPDPAARETTVTTSDGRTLGVAEYGPPDGFPVFSLHGTPGCRYGPPPVDQPDLFDVLGARVVEYDRPGYGRSTRMPGRTVADAAADVAAIADHLDIDRFAVTGGSGGGPHCLAVATLLGDRTTRAACVVGVAPLGPGGLSKEEWLRGMTKGNVDEFEWALAGEETLRPQLERLASDEIRQAADDPANLLGPDYELSEGDRAVLADPRRHERILRGTQEAFRTGIDGWIDDNLLFTQRSWGFDVTALRVPTLVWFGLADTLVPAAHGEWLAHNVPGAQVVRMAGGHMDLVHRVPDLFGWLVGGETPVDATAG